MSHIHGVNVMAVGPDDITTTDLGDTLVCHIGCGAGRVSVFTDHHKSVNAAAGTLVQIGERLAREARRAGHQHRTRLRTERLERAWNHANDMRVLRAELAALEAAGA